MTNVLWSMLLSVSMIGPGVPFQIVVWFCGQTFHFKKFDSNFNQEALSHYLTLIISLFRKKSLNEKLLMIILKINFSEEF